MPITKSPLTWSGMVASVAAAALLASCGLAPAGGTKPGSATSSQAAPSGPSSAPSSEPPPPPVVMTPSVKNGTKKVAVDTMISVKAADGKLTKVSVSYSGVDPKGRKFSGKLPGALAKNGSSWKAVERLEPSATYRISMVGTASSDGATTKQTTTFATSNLSLAKLTFASAYPLKGSTVGVGMPAIIRFDVPIKDKAAFQKHLKVTTKPKQTGSWHWFSDTEVHYRPKSFWRPGTTVSVGADVNSVNAGNGVYGQNSTSTSFKIGSSLITRVDLNSKVARVYRGGSLIRTIYISAGKPGWTTRSGTKLIMDKLPVTRMTNQMIGAQEEYDLQVRWAMRITSSGEFLHAAPWNAGNFGRVNASHGCVGMSTGDAAWLFNQVQIGDPVITTGSNKYAAKGNGYTDWEMSWSQYKKGSAL